MCGVPVHAAEGYLLTLIRKGFRVAIAEQMEDPAEAKKRGSKSVVRRDVVRLVTPGTLTEDALLEARRHNFLCAFAEVRDEAALAWADISTGELRVMPCPACGWGRNWRGWRRARCLLSEARDGNLAGLVTESGAALTRLSRGSFDSASAERRLCALFNVTTLEAFGLFDRAELSAMGALVDYLDLTQRGKLPLLRPPCKEAAGGAVQIDAATRRNLELTQALSGGREGSLVGGGGPDGDGGGRAAAGAADFGAVARSDGDPCTAGIGAVSAGTEPFARRFARCAAAGAGYGPGAVTAGAGPGRAARSDRHSGGIDAGRGCGGAAARCARAAGWGGGGLGGA